MITVEIKYKKTGIDWMPEVPEHWDVVRLKNVSKIVSGATPKSSVSANWDGNINWVTPAEFGDEMYIGESVRKITKTGLESCAASLVPIGSIILSNRAPIGSLGISKVDLSTNQGCKSIIPTNINNYFLYFLMTLQKENLNVLGNGTTFRELSTHSLRNYKIPLPPNEEQDRIASHLYDENKKIAHFIQTKQRFIALLKEQRQSIITNAVTKGIDEKVQMKETGIEWMPQIPEHWEVRRLKYLVELYKHNKSGNNPVNSAFKLALENIDNWTGKYIESVSPDFEGEGRYFKQGDVLFCKLRPYLAKAFLPEKDGICVGEILVFTPNSELVTSEFLFQRILTKGFIDIVDGSTYGAKMPRASWDFIGNMRIAFPPTIEEQTQIAEHIKTETRTLDIAISKAEREIELIKEYREAMIAEAVTGKMKL